MKEIERDKFLNSVLQCYTDEQNAVLQNTPSFLAIINRSYDEDLISKVLAYILKNDYGFAEKLLRRYSKKKITFYVEQPLDINGVEVFCEKTMNSGRADIFAVISATDSKYTITIENKIYSGIHGTAEDDDQTQTYFRYVDTFYKNAKNAFFLLKPNFNPTYTMCQPFETITYEDIIEFISVDNPRIDESKIKDFTKHVKEHLIMSEPKFTVTDKKLLSNWHEYKEILKTTENAINKFKNWLFSSVSDSVFAGDKKAFYNYFYSYGKEQQDIAWEKAKNEAGLTNDTKDDAECCKFYRVEKWYKWHENDTSNNYWFYVEIKFENNDPNTIIVQSVLKCYGRQQDSVVKRFVESEDFKAHKKYIVPLGSYYVFDTAKINENINAEPFTPDWQEAIKQAVIKEVTKQCTNMEDIFNSFIDYTEKSKA